MENESNVTYEAKLSAVAKELRFETVYTPDDWEERVVTCSDTLRPGLALTGFYDCFDINNYGFCSLCSKTCAGVLLVTSHTSNTVVENNGYVVTSVINYV